MRNEIDVPSTRIKFLSPHSSLDPHYELQQHLEINQWNATIHGIADMSEAGACIEAASSRRTVVRVETDRLRRPGAGDANDLLDAQSASTPPLIIRAHRHVRQIDWVLAGGEIRPVDCPRFASAESKSGDGGPTAAHQPDLGDAHVVQRTALRWLTRPVPVPESPRQLLRGSSAERDDRGHIPLLSLTKAQARSGTGAQSGTSSVVVARDLARPRSRAYFTEPGVWYFSR